MNMARLKNGFRFLGRQNFSKTFYMWVQSIVRPSCEGAMRSMISDCGYTFWKPLFTSLFVLLSFFCFLFFFAQNICFLDVTVLHEGKVPFWCFRLVHFIALNSLYCTEKLKLSSLFYTLVASLGFGSLEIFLFNPSQFTELEAWVLNMREFVRLSHSFLLVMYHFD